MSIHNHDNYCNNNKKKKQFEKVTFSQMAFREINVRFALWFTKSVNTLSQKYLIVKSMQRSGTEAIGTQIQPSKPKREINKITNSQNKKRTYGQPG